MKCNFYPEILFGDECDMKTKWAERRRAGSSIVIFFILMLIFAVSGIFPPSAHAPECWILFIITKIHFVFFFFSFRCASFTVLASDKYFPSLFFFPFASYFMTPITVMDNNFLLNTRSRLRSRAYAVVTPRDDRNGKWAKFKVIYSFGTRPSWQTTIPHTHTHTHIRASASEWSRSSQHHLEWEKGKQASYRVTVSWSSIGIRSSIGSSENEAKWWICKYFYFYIFLFNVFVAFFVALWRRRNGTARMSSTTERAHGHLSTSTECSVYGKWSSFPFSA